MTIKDLIEFGINELESVSDNARKEIELLILEYTNFRQIDLIINVKSEINEKEYSLIIEKIAKRKKGIPIQYIIGNQEFMNLEFSVNEKVLIPRQDTEILVEKIISLYSKFEKVRVLDIGTGSGAISISLAKYLKNSSIVSVDISIDAINVAKGNAKLNGVLDQIEFIQSDLFNNLTNDNKFDIIVSNPPYIRSEEIAKLQIEIKDYEPVLALDGGNDGLDFYRKITEESIRFLKKNGMLAYEIGFDQGEGVRRMLLRKFNNIEVIKDYQHLDRMVIGYLK
ncbi:MAG: peptide chain release factor N(5)-glutamine methyltransferase [Bacillota bacterium]|nr:peptide chain release factor N(5)-glutamine methyltransferase [Bacillota bacterium]